MKRRDVLKYTSMGMASLAVPLTSGVSAFDVEPVEREQPLRDLTFTNDEYLRRHERIRVEMEKYGFDCLLFFGTNGWYRGDGGNMRYVAGDASVSDLDPSYVIFPGKGSPVLAGHPLSLRRAFHGNGLQQIMERAPAGIRKDTGNSADSVPLVTNLVKKMGFSKGSVGIVGMRFFPAEMYAALIKEFPGAKFQDAEVMMNQVRLVKSEQEIGFLKRSGQAADTAMQALLDALVPGVTAEDLRVAVDIAFMRLGCEASLQIISTQKWEPDSHAQSAGKKIQAGDLVINELTSNYKGYYTRVAKPIIYRAEPKQTYLDLIDLNKSVYHECRNSFRPGITVDELDRKAQELTARLSNNKWYTPFLCQTVDFEQLFLHAPTKITAGVGYVLMPWFLWNKGVKNYGISSGFEGHLAGNTLVCTEGEPIDLNNTTQDLVIV